MWSLSLWLAYFFNSCICCTEASQQRSLRGKWCNAPSGCGKAQSEHFTWLQTEQLNGQNYAQSCFLTTLRVFPSQRQNADDFHYSADHQRRMACSAAKSGLQVILIKSRDGYFLLTKLWRSCSNRERRWRRRRAGPELWFEVILSHEGTSSSSASGKTDSAEPHEDNSVLPVIFPKTASVQRGKLFL